MEMRVYKKVGWEEGRGGEGGRSERREGDKKQGCTWAYMYMYTHVYIHNVVIHVHVYICIKAAM